MINISRLWYVTTAIHLWRFYFRYITADPNKMTESNRLNWIACEKAVKKFTDQEKELLTRYYLTEYGNYEDMKVIKEYANEIGISDGRAWDIIKDANYEVIVQRGLMERKEGDSA